MGYPRFEFGFLPNDLLRGVVLATLAGALLVLAAPSARSRVPSAAKTLRAQGAPAASQNNRSPSEPDIPEPLPKGKKLFLADGTFQIVREYQRDGDRVRYYSVERSAWEEIPASLVDWKATEKAEAQQEAEEKALAEKSEAADRAARVANLDADTSFEVRPGIILPDPAGLYALDGKAILTLRQSLAVSQADKGRAVERVLTGIPLIKGRAKVEIPGERAAIRLHSGDPEFYFRTADGREPQVSLLRTEVKGGARQLTTMSVDGVGEASYKNDEVPLLLWDAARGLYRLTLQGSMGPGEYAIVEKSSEGLSLYVWDFGVDANVEASGKSAAANGEKHK